MALYLTTVLSTLTAIANLQGTAAPNVTNSTTDESGYWQPTAGATWNIQLITPPTVAEADNANYTVWDFDLVDTPNATVTAFKNANHNVICYFSAGSREKGRPDFDRFPNASVGKVMDGWPDENWIDTRDPTIRQIMADRIALAAAKGCDGVDPDNIDGYGNDTGFNLTEDDGVDYVNFLAQTAHAAGMAYGLKNGGDIVDRVVNVSQWCIQEQCHIYKVSDKGPSECSLYRAFIDANKPVFNIEYTKDEPAKASFVKQSCTDTAAADFSVLMKHLSLNTWAEPCPVIA